MKSAKLLFWIGTGVLGLSIIDLSFLYGYTAWYILMIGMALDLVAIILYIFAFSKLLKADDAEQKKSEQEHKIPLPH